MSGGKFGNNKFDCTPEFAREGVGIQIHELKTDYDVFAMSWIGLKPWEIRFNDRDYQVGDILILRETLHSGEEMRKGMPLRYTGRQVTRSVDYICSAYGLAEGWVIMTVSSV